VVNLRGENGGSGEEVPTKVQESEGRNASVGGASISLDFSVF